jgi:hypothetical protein
VTVTKLDIDVDWMKEVLLELLRIPSPSGRTDVIMQHVGERLEEIGLPFEVTRRGVMVGSLDGEEDTLDRAIVVHTDTIGCMVRRSGTTDASRSSRSAPTAPASPRAPASPSSPTTRSTPTRARSCRRRPPGTPSGTTSTPSRSGGSTSRSASTNR